MGHRKWGVCRRSRELPRWLSAFQFTALALLASGCGAAYGASAQGERLRTMQWSRHYYQGEFHNIDPMHTSTWDAVTAILAGGKNLEPEEPIPVERVDRQRFATAPDSGVRITWLGHSTTLIELGEETFLTDPVWGPRASPYSWVGPKRWYPPPLPLGQLPELDAVLISHDHYDHLDYPTIVALGERSTQFIVPLGVGAHLVHWGIPESEITELDWWDELSVGSTRLALVPSRHASGRSLFDQNETLWGGYALVGTRHRIYFSGDTGMFPALRDIGTRYGPFDVAMIEVGAYNAAWPDWHMGPEQAVLAHRMVRGATLFPIHWGLFDLATHSWTEPIERVLSAAQGQGVVVTTPRPGQSVELGEATAQWWPNLPWKGPKEAPIVATQNGDPKRRVDLKQLQESLAPRDLR